MLQENSSDKRLHWTQTPEGKKRLSELNRSGKIGSGSRKFKKKSKVMERPRLIRNGVPLHTAVLARKLKRAIIAEIAESGDISPVNELALIFIRAVMLD